MKYIIATLCLFVPAQAQEQARGKFEIQIPESSIEDPSDVGKRAHTNHRILVGPDGGTGVGGGMEPRQIQSFYTGATYVTGGSGIIAIVDAYDYSNAVSDFNVFCARYGLPTGTLQVVYESSKPRPNSSWNLEAALDIQWAHAMAPSATILLVEAKSSSFVDMFNAVKKAKALGASQVSMSWGGSEWAGQTSFDPIFDASGVTFFAASGDTGGTVGYPSTSPFVVAVGGTHVETDGSTLNVSTEKGWTGSGGGPSLVYLTKPSYQSAVTLGSARLVPDISADADPNSGVSVYCNKRWYIVGGTSASTPIMAGLVNLSNSKLADPTKAPSSTTALLTAIYSHLGDSDKIRDVTQDFVPGTGWKDIWHCGDSWDYVTGVGAPKGLAVFQP